MRTGRSVRGNLSPYGRPETIDDTADMIRTAGGIAIPIRVDHTIESDVEALFGRIDREHGRLDVLVNSIAGEEPMMKQYNSFWKTNLKNGDVVFRQALLSHIITAKHAVPLMIRAQRGLIVEVTENDFLSAGGNPLMQTVKLALKGLAFNMAAELSRMGVGPSPSARPPPIGGDAGTLRRHQANWRNAGKKNKVFLNRSRCSSIPSALAQDQTFSRDQSAQVVRLARNGFKDATAGGGWGPSRSFSVLLRLWLIGRNRLADQLEGWRVVEDCGGFHGTGAQLSGPPAQRADSVGHGWHRRSRIVQMAQLRVARVSRGVPVDYQFDHAL